MSSCVFCLADNMQVLPLIPDNCVDLVYIDPPFNTGSTRVGRSGSYPDRNERYIPELQIRIGEILRILKPSGSLFLHLDPSWSHYCKVMVDSVFGRDSFMNEIVWAYDFGGRSKARWPRKHDVIFWYAKSPDDYVFRRDECDKIPYMAPGLVGPEKAKKGKYPTDVWWHTIVGTASKERTGYPTQKPRGVIDRIVKVHTYPGDVVLDCYAGSGTLGESSMVLDRNCILVDQEVSSKNAVEQRMSRYGERFSSVDLGDFSFPFA